MCNSFHTGRDTGGKEITIEQKVISDLIAVSIKVLARMQLDSGYFCEQVIKGESHPHGRSIRYTLIVLLGLQRAKAAGWSFPFEVERIWDRVFRELSDADTTLA